MIKSIYHFHKHEACQYPAINSSSILAFLSKEAYNNSGKVAKFKESKLYFLCMFCQSFEQHLIKGKILLCYIYLDTLPHFFVKLIPIPYILCMSVVFI